MKLLLALCIVLIGVARCCLSQAHPVPPRTYEHLAQAFTRIRAVHRNAEGSYRQGLGSGFIVAQRGGNTYVLTCYHIVKAPDDYAAEIIFVEREGTTAEYYDIGAEIQHFDPVLDLVLLRVPEKIGASLTLGVNPDTYSWGIGYGSPATHLPFAFPVLFGGTVFYQGQPRIRLTGPVTFGISGTALVDPKGNVRAMVSQGIMDVEGATLIPGYGLAIPATTLRAFLRAAGL